MSIALQYARPSYMPKFMPDSTCVLWLPGQDDPQSATIRDRSGKGNNGTLTSTTWVRLSGGLRALSLDGTNSYVEASDVTSLDITTAYSIIIWAKTANPLASKVAFSKWNQTGDQRSWAVLLGTGTIVFYSSVDGINAIANSQNWTPSASTWYCAGFTYNGTNLIHYLNGTPIGSPTAIAALYAGTSPVWLGRDGNGGLAGRWNSLLALPIISNACYTASQMAGIYQRGRHLFGV